MEVTGLNLRSCLGHGVFEGSPRGMEIVHNLFFACRVDRNVGKRILIRLGNGHQAPQLFDDNLHVDLIYLTVLGKLTHRTSHNFFRIFALQSHARGNRLFELDSLGRIGVGGFFDDGHGLFGRGSKENFGRLDRARSSIKELCLIRERVNTRELLHHVVTRIDEHNDCVLELLGKGNESVKVVVVGLLDVVGQGLLVRRGFLEGLFLALNVVGIVDSDRQGWLCL